MKENMWETIRELLLAFCMATTGTVFVCAAYTSVFWRGVLLNGNILWQILLLCLVCSLSIFIHPRQETGRKGRALNMVLRYLYINLVVLGGGHLFKWLDIKNIFMLAVMILAILFIFIVVSAAMWRMYERESEDLNRKLREYQSAGDVEE